MSTSPVVLAHGEAEQQARQLVEAAAALAAGQPPFDVLSPPERATHLAAMMTDDMLVAAANDAANDRDLLAAVAEELGRRARRIVPERGNFNDLRTEERIRYVVRAGGEEFELVVPMNSTRSEMLEALAHFTRAAVHEWCNGVDENGGPIVEVVLV